MDLKTYLAGLTGEQREKLANACETTTGHLKNVSYGYRPCAEKLAIALERESERAVTCEEIRPDVDWKYLRGTAAESADSGTAPSRSDAA